MGKRRIRPPRPNEIFTIGDGEGQITQQEADLIVHKLALWFASEQCDRDYDDPMLAAKQIFQQCMIGLNHDGSQWINAPGTLAARIRTKALYDIETDTGKAVDKRKSPAAKKPTMPEADALRAAFNEAQYTAAKVKEILDAYPELNTPAHKPNVERLAILYAQQELMRQQLTMTTRMADRLEALKGFKDITNTSSELMRVLDIHPDQVSRRMSRQKEGTLGELVALLDGDDYFLERERIWALQLALQLWWASSHPNGRGDGPNLEPFEIWHLTRTRPFSFTCQCGRHFDNLIDGFTPKELKDFLIRKGVLVEEPAIPQLLTTDQLQGLADYGESPSSDSDVREGTVERTGDGDDSEDEGIGTDLPGS